MLRTVPRRGIQMVCPVTVSDAPNAPADPARPEQRVRFARSRDGTLIAYATTGHGPPLLRGSHWLTHLEHDWRSPVWRPFLDALGASFSVTRYDQRGSGLSARSVDRLDLEAMTDDLEAVADASGLDRFPIYAGSQGVPVALAFAARRPERVTRMVLYGGYALGRALREDSDQRAEGAAFLTLLKTGWGKPGSAFMTAFTAVFMPEATREQTEFFVAMQLASADAGYPVRLRTAIDRFDVRELLPRIRAPVLVVHARNDAVHPLDQACQLAAGIPGAELLVLEGNNHIVLPQDPAFPVLVKAITAFAGG